MPAETAGSAPRASRAGITTNEKGERHIPSSVRADGSVRKEIRIRPGYKPPEDVELYRNRAAESWKSRAKTAVPGAELAEPAPTTSSPAVSRRTAKRKENKKPEVEVGKSTATQTAAADAETFADRAESAQDQMASVPDPEADAEKEAKKLTKRLRQARDLELKKEQGDSLLPEQFAKVIKISELTRQLDKLGFDTDGNKKKDDSSGSGKPSD